MRLINYRDILYTFYQPHGEGLTKRGQNREDFIKNNIPPNLIGAELGVAGGKHAQYLWKWSSPSYMVLVDLWDKVPIPSTGLPYYHLGSKEKALLGYEKIVRWSNDKNIEVIKGDIIQTANQFDDEFFDWIYLDGEHTFESVTKDLQAWWPKIKKGGFLCGDDYALFDQKAKFGVERALMEYFPEDKGIYLEVQSINKQVPQRVDSNNKPWTFYTYKITK